MMKDFIVDIAAGYIFLFLLLGGIAAIVTGIVFLSKTFGLAFLVVSLFVAVMLPFAALIGSDVRNWYSTRGQ